MMTVQKNVIWLAAAAWWQWDLHNTRLPWGGGGRGTEGAGWMLLTRPASKGSCVRDVQGRGQGGEGERQAGRRHGRGRERCWWCRGCAGDQKGDFHSPHLLPGATGRVLTTDDTRARSLAHTVSAFDLAPTFLPAKPLALCRPVSAERMMCGGVGRGEGGQDDEVLSHWMKQRNTLSMSLARRWTPVETEAEELSGTSTGLPWRVTSARHPSKLGINQRKGPSAKTCKQKNDARL